MTYKTCNHLYDTGGACNSAAVTDRNYCAFHLGYRARQLRSAQARARMERFDLRLPPIESMASVLSAVNQLVEAVAADMIDLKRADFLLKSLRFAAQALKSSDKWQPSIYHSDQPAPAIDLAAEYGLPADLDVDTPPEVAFPYSPTPAASETSHWPLATDHFSDLSPMPSSGYCREHGDDCPDLVIRADHPVTPEMVEILEISETEGSDAAARRGNQLARNRKLREMRSSSKRYAAIALEKNMRIAAEKLAARRTAAPKTEPESLETKKPPASATLESAPATEKEAKSIA